MTAVLKFTPLGLAPALVNAHLMQKNDAHPGAFTQLRTK
jgi:hypothetical protein